MDIPIDADIQNILGIQNATTDYIIQVLFSTDNDHDILEIKILRIIKNENGEHEALWSFPLLNKINDIGGIYNDRNGNDIHVIKLKNRVMILC